MGALVWKNKCVTKRMGRIVVTSNRADLHDRSLQIDFAAAPKKHLRQRVSVEASATNCRLIGRAAALFNLSEMSLSVSHCSQWEVAKKCRQEWHWQKLGFIFIAFYLAGANMGNVLRTVTECFLCLLSLCCKCNPHLEMLLMMISTLS